jgi:DDE domain
MQRFNPIETVFKGRHFDGQPARSGDHGGRPRYLRDAYNDSPGARRYLPEFEKPGGATLAPGGSRRVDETYINIHRQWVYSYRAVDKAGQTVMVTGVSWGSASDGANLMADAMEPNGWNVRFLGSNTPSPPFAGRPYPCYAAKL